MADNWVSSALYYGDGTNERKVHYETDTKNIVDFEQAVNNLINTSFGDTTFRGTTTFENIHVTGTSQMDGLVTCDSGILTKGNININNRGSISSDVNKVTVSSKNGSYIDLTAGDGVSIHSDGNVDTILSIDKSGILSYNNNAVFEGNTTFKGNVTMQGTVSSPIKLPYTTITSNSTSTTIATTSGSSVVLSNSATGDVQLKTKSNHTFALTTEGKLTVDGNEVASKKVILNAVYPVGCTYITLGNTNPSSFLGIGTWERIGDGLQLAIVGTAKDKNNTSHSISAGANAGEWTHTITVSEMPEHDHPVAKCSKEGAHKHSRGDMNIKASGFLGEAAGHPGSEYEAFQKQATGALYYSGTGKWGSSGGIDQDDYVGHFDASRKGAWTGETSENGSHSHTIDIGNRGKGNAHNIINPLFGVYLWKRVS